MDLWTVVKVVFRRWYAVLPILALTAYVAYEVAYKAPPTYEANGSALLVAPNTTTGVQGNPVKQNPYLLFSGSLNITAGALVRVINDPAVRDEFSRAGLLADYDIGVDPSTPTIGVTAVGDTPQVAIDTVRRVLREVDARLRGLQNTADAPADSRIGIELLVNPSTALTLRGEVARTMATIGALGLAAAVALALLWEAAAAARRRSKAERRARRQLEQDLLLAEQVAVEPQPLPQEVQSEPGLVGVPDSPPDVVATPAASVVESDDGGRAEKEPGEPATAQAGSEVVTAPVATPAKSRRKSDGKRPARKASDEEPAAEQASPGDGPVPAETTAAPVPGEDAGPPELDTMPAAPVPTRRRSKRKPAKAAPKPEADQEPEVVLDPVGVPNDETGQAPTGEPESAPSPRRSKRARSTPVKPDHEPVTVPAPVDDRPLEDALAVDPAAAGDDGHQPGLAGDGHQPGFAGDGAEHRPARPAAEAPEQPDPPALEETDDEGVRVLAPAASGRRGFFRRGSG